MPWVDLMRLLKRTLVTLAGAALLLAGLAMIVLPGPAFVVIPVALAILASTWFSGIKLLCFAGVPLDQPRPRSSQSQRSPSTCQF
jgi:hypothetical protein